MRKQDPRKLDGVLLLDKPLELTSNRILQRVKHLYGAAKAGHTGSLDPLATGMLPICFGEATKYSQYLLDADKTYFVKAKLGVRTTTSDREGEVVSSKVVPSLQLAQLDKAFDVFRGEIEQIPSMYSALKYQGQALYKYARQGIEVPREKRTITVYHIAVLHYSDEIVTFNIRCSKGTYVRTIVDDLGEVLGCGAHVIELRRTAVGEFHEEAMVTFEQLQALGTAESYDVLDALLLPTDVAVRNLPALYLNTDLVFYVKQGHPVLVSNLPAGQYFRLYDKENNFFGLAELLEDGRIAPKRLIAIAN